VLSGTMWGHTRSSIKPPSPLLQGTQVPLALADQMAGQAHGSGNIRVEAELPFLSMRIMIGLG
jgi:hypothetical protein